MTEHAHAFCIVTAVVLAGLNVIALYWLARCDSVIKNMAQALLNDANHMQFTAGMIEGQRERIAELEAEIERLRDFNIVDFPRREPRK